MPDSHEFRRVYRQFLRTTKGVVENRLNRISGEPEKRHATDLTKRVFDALLEKAAIEVVAETFKSLSETSDPPDWPEGKSEVVLGALLAEMQFFNARYATFRTETGGDHNKADDGADDSEEVKGSLEQILGSKLPKWIKDLLKVLNEILSLVRPI